VPRCIQKDGRQLPRNVAHMININYYYILLNSAKQM
jgi:hypothetical protein